MPATLPMLPKTFQKLIRLQSRKSRPDLDRFGRDVREVMSTRIWLAITGKLNAVEASRMVFEKQVAALRAQLSPGILHPRAASASISISGPCIPTAKGSVNIGEPDGSLGANTAGIAGVFWEWLALVFDGQSALSTDKQ